MFYTRNKEAELKRQMDNDVAVKLEELTNLMRKEMDAKIDMLRAEIYDYIKENSLSNKVKRGTDELINEAKSATKDVAGAATATFKKIKEKVKPSKE